MNTMRSLIVYSAFGSAFILSLILIVSQISFAQVSSSTNYRIESDSINFGGGLSSSTNFVQESTFGEIATGRSTSSSYSLRAGYQQMQEVYLSMTDAADVVMSPDLGGITGGDSNGSTTVTVITDSPAGYSLSIKSENDPAMQSGASSIDDLPNGAAPVVIMNSGLYSGQAYFGFTPDGDDVVQFFKSNGGACNAGTISTLGVCWAGLELSDRVIAAASGSNHPAGTDTDIAFRVSVGSNAAVPSGLYTATTTLTALPL